MSPVALERGLVTRRTRDGITRRAGCISVGGEPTLDALLSGVWEGLAAHRAVACPLCAGELRPEYGAHALPIGGRCVECGTRLN